MAKVDVKVCTFDVAMSLSSYVFSPDAAPSHGHGRLLCPDGTDSYKYPSGRGMLCHVHILRTELGPCRWSCWVNRVWGRPALSTDTSIAPSRLHQRTPLVWHSQPRRWACSNRLRALHIISHTHNAVAIHHCWAAAFACANDDPGPQLVAVARAVVL